jgi:hypothetical protein
MRKWNHTVTEEGTVDAMARLREQDDKFCQTLRAAIERGREFCPTVVSQGRSDPSWVIRGQNKDRFLLHPGDTRFGGGRREAGTHATSRSSRQFLQSQRCNLLTNVRASTTVKVPARAACPNAKSLCWRVLTELTGVITTSQIHGSRAASLCGVISGCE